MGLIFNFLKQNTDGQEQKVFLLSENPNYIFSEFEWNLERLFYPQDFFWDGEKLHFIVNNDVAK